MALIGISKKKYWRFSSPLEAFSPEPNTGCWLWMGTVHEAVHGDFGYGELQYKGKRAYAHRWMYEHFKGPIPAGMFIDHLCRTRACVNPDHMEAVTIGENTRRGNLCRMTPSDVARWRDQYARGSSAVEIAEREGMGKESVRAAVLPLAKGATWTDVPYPSYVNRPNVPRGRSARPRSWMPI